MTGYARVFADSPSAEDCIYRFYAWVAKHDRVYGLGSTAEAVERMYQRRSATLHTRRGARPERVGTSDWPEDYAPWRRDAFAMAETAPFSAGPDLCFQIARRTWPVRNPAPAVGAATTPPTLLIAAGDDRAFYQGALEPRRRFPQLVLVSEPGSITGPSFVGSKCVDTTIARHLRDGTLPARRSGRHHL